MHGLEEEIGAAFGAMTDSQKRVAQYVVRNLEDVAFLTLEDLASRSEVSTATVIRFARALGHGGYSEFQTKIQEMVRARVGLAQRLVQSGDGTEDNVYSRAFQHDIGNIQATMRGISRDVLDSVVDEIVAAKSIYVTGGRTSYSVAFVAATVLGQMLGNVRLLHEEAGALPEQVMMISQGDLCIAVSFPRYVRVPVEVARRARKQGAKVVAICDSLLAPIAESADYLLTCEFEGISFKNSLVAPLSLVNGIIAAVALKAKERTTATLSRSDELLNEWDYCCMPL